MALKSIKPFFHLRQGSSLIFAFGTMWWQKLRNVKESIFHEKGLKIAPIEKNPLLWPFPSIARRAIEQSSLIVIVTQTPRVYLITDTKILSYFLSFLAGQRFFSWPRKETNFFSWPKKEAKKKLTPLFMHWFTLSWPKKEKKKHALK